MKQIARQVVATGQDAAAVASKVVDELAAPDLRVAFVYADARLDPATIAGTTYRGLRAPVVGGISPGILGPVAMKKPCGAVGLGLYGDWVRVGIGVAPELSKSALTRSRDAVTHAANALGIPAAALDPSRHVGVSVLDGTCGHEEAFCVGSSAAAPQIRVVGGCSASTTGAPGTASIWVNGEVMRDAGAVILLDSEVPFQALTSAHLVPTDKKTVVTAASGRVIHELDGRPAAPRLRALIAELGDRLDEPRPSHTFARYIEGTPYVRSITAIEGDDLQLATAVEPGHVLRVMRPGDLIGTTRKELAAARERVGGSMSALLLFSCIGRHWEAEARGLECELAQLYAEYPVVGFQSFGEQSGMLLVNHTLTGLAIGSPR